MIGQISPEQLTATLRQNFPAAEVVVEDMAGDNNHYSIYIKSAEFAGLPLIQQHRLVYDRLGELAGIIHAMKIKTVAG